MNRVVKWGLLIAQVGHAILLTGLALIFVPLGLAIIYAIIVA